MKVIIDNEEYIKKSNVIPFSEIRIFEGTVKSALKDCLRRENTRIRK